MPQINQAGLDLIRNFEGCRLDAYQDSAGVWTIGYGHTGPVNGQPVAAGMTITQDTADDLLREDLAWAEKCVNDAVSHDATPNQFAAMVSLAYNIGCGAFNSSSVLREFNDGFINAAREDFALWNEAGGQVLEGLVRRRAAEAQLFGTPG